MFKLPTTENHKGLRDISVEQREYPHLIPRFVFGSLFVYELRRQVSEISGNPRPYFMRDNACAAQGKCSMNTF